MQVKNTYKIKIINSKISKFTKLRGNKTKTFEDKHASLSLPLQDVKSKVITRCQFKKGM